jgi:hypothetical protein
MRLTNLAKGAHFLPLSQYDVTSEKQARHAIQGFIFL